MWIPKNTEEIIEAVSSGNLVETETFDAKSRVDDNATETAKDIAAMANYGGVIIYGIDEDENKRLTKITPVPLLNFEDKISQIVDTCIVERPHFTTRQFPLGDDPTMGFVAVIVPASDRAPHMVIRKQDNRYYARNNTISVRMQEGQVAQLYERRQRWKVDREALLDGLIQSPPIEGHPDIGVLHAFAKPVGPINSPLSATAFPSSSVTEAYFNMASKAGNIRYCHPGSSSLPSPTFKSLFHLRPKGFGIILESDRYPYEYPPDHNPAFFGNFMTLEIGTDDAFCRLYSGNAVRITGQLQIKTIDMMLIANNLVQFLIFTGMLYEMTKYFGTVDVGMAVTNTKGAQRENIWREGLIYEGNDYRRTERVSVEQLMDRDLVVLIAKSLSQYLFSELTRGKHDPFTVYAFV